MGKICDWYRTDSCDRPCDGLNSSCGEYCGDLTPNEETDYHKFDYQLLDRCRSDCEYYLNDGNRKEDILWGKSIEEYIRKMKDLYCLLPEKPEWLTFAQIEEYERRMKAR